MRGCRLSSFGAELALWVLTSRGSSTFAWATFSVTVLRLLSPLRVLRSSARTRRWLRIGGCRRERSPGSADLSRQASPNRRARAGAAHDGRYELLRSVRDLSTGRDRADREDHGGHEAEARPA